MSLQWDCSSSSVFSMQHQTFTWLAAGRDKKADESPKTVQILLYVLGISLFLSLQFHPLLVPAHKAEPCTIDFTSLLASFLDLLTGEVFYIEQGERLFVDVTVGNKWGEWSFALLSLFPSFFPRFSFVFYLTFPLFLYICLPVCFL